MSGSTRLPSAAAQTRQQGQASRHRLARKVRSPTATSPSLQRPLERLDPSCSRRSTTSTTSIVRWATWSTGWRARTRWCRRCRRAGRNLTRQDVLEAIEQNGSKWDATPLVPSSATTSTTTAVTAEQRWARSATARRALVGGPLTTTPDPSSPITPYTTPLFPPPALRSAQQLRISWTGNQPYSIVRKTRTGAPAAIENAGRSVVTPESAPITHRSPIVTPLVITRGAAPHVVADARRALRGEALPGDRLVGVVEAVVAVGDEAAVGEHAVLADLDPLDARRPSRRG